MPDMGSSDLRARCFGSSARFLEVPQSFFQCVNARNLESQAANCFAHQAVACADLQRSLQGSNSGDGP